MLDIGEYIIDEPHHQFGNGYDQLEGDYAIYYKVATKFVYKAQAQDREDLLHTIMLNLAVAGRNNGRKPDNPSWMYRIASFTVAQYWRDYYRRTYGIDCGHCSNQQRKKCKADDLYSECPRAIMIERLNKPIAGEDGELSELGELIADDKALDLAEWTNINTFIRGCPQRLIDIAEKRRDGIPLTKYEQLYLCRYWKKHEKRLIE
jgi:DNA-directed RNA polymerase specialized sigma24 family protein